MTAQTKQEPVGRWCANACKCSEPTVGDAAYDKMWLPGHGDAPWWCGTCHGHLTCRLDVCGPPDTSLVRAYQQYMLVMLLQRRLGLEEIEDATNDVLDAIRSGMSAEQRAQAGAWTAALPLELRNGGQPLRPVDDWESASGDCVCEICTLAYREHPCDPREEGHLHVTCDGRRWKL